MSDSRCTGHCCRCFTLSASYEELKQSVESRSRDDKMEVSRLEDDEFVLDMLIPLGKLTEEEALKLAGPIGNDKPFNPDAERFTCRHFDGTNCTVYEDRPAMCREYAVTRPPRCEYLNCTLSGQCSGAMEKAE